MPASPVPAGYPLHVSNFNTLSSGEFFLNGNSSSTEITAAGALQLTDNENSESATAVYNTPFSSTTGISFNFTYNSSGGGTNGGDGIAFDLLDGDKLGANITSTSVTPGGYGGGLGYSDDGQAGITDGFLSVALDTFGNNSTADRGQDPAPGVTDKVPNEVVVRGQGSDTTGYDYITGAHYAPGIDGQRNVQVNLTPIDSTHESLTVYVAPAGTTNYTEVVNTVVNQVLPSELYFGFSASSGGATDVHAITSLDVSLPVDLTLSAATVFDTTSGKAAPAMLAPGDFFTYTYTVTDGGPNDDGTILLNDALPANIINASYSVQDDAGSHTGTGSAIGINLESGDTATVTVSGQVDPNATPGNANHVVTVDPGTAYRLTDPNASTGVTLQIGPNGSSVSLVNANRNTAGSDKASVSPFPTATVVDTFTDPSTGVSPIDTLSVTVNPAEGSLSADGATYNAATGVLTANGNAATLTGILDSVAFTPSKHTVALGAVQSVQIVTSVVDNDPSNTTGNGMPSATQTATVAVSPVADTPAVAGGKPVVASDTGGQVAPLASVVVTDPDYVAESASVRIVGGVSNSVSFTAASSAGWSVATDGQDLVYTLPIPAQHNVGVAVTAAIQALMVDPTPHLHLAGSTLTTPFTVQVTDGVGVASNTDTAASLSVTASVDPLVASVAAAVPSIPDTVTVTPFSADTVTDPDFDTGKAVVTITDGVQKGDFTPASTLGWTRAVDGDDIVYSKTLPAAANVGQALQSAIAGLVFQPTSGATAAGVSSTTAISAVLSTGSGMVAPVSINAAVTADGSLLPFLPLSATGSSTETISVAAALPSGSHGTFSLLGSGTIEPDGLTYLVSGTAAQVNQALHTVAFTPDPGTTVPAGYTAQVLGTNAAQTTLADAGVNSVQLASPQGNNTVTAGVGNDVIFGGADMSLLQGGGGDNTFVVGSGATTISAGLGSALVYGNTGSTTLYNGPKVATVVGGGGDSTVYGGSGAANFYGSTGNSVFFGGSAGHNVFISGTGNNTVFGGGDADQLVLVGPGSALVAAGSGNETLSGSGSSGTGLYFGGTGHGLIAAGSGQSTMVEGTGTDTVFASASGATATFAGSGAETVVSGAGLDTVVAGSGTALTYAGTGSDQFVSINHHAGGSMVIQDFNVSKDQVALFGYGSDVVAQAEATATLSGGSTTLNLSDGTRITLAGISSVEHVNLVGA